MNKILSICALLLTTTTLNAQTWNIGSPNETDVTATLGYYGTLTISGTGKMKNFSSTTTPWYSERKSIKTIIIDDGVTSIGSYAFYYCPELTSITIPESVTSIGNGAFSGCSKLTSITIPNSVTYIGNRAFVDCYRLTAIDVESENTKYSSENGVLFNKVKDMLIQLPGGKQGAYTIPSNVTTIGSYAFFNFDSLTSVTIPNSVTSIESYAFYACEGLKKLVLEDGSKDLTISGADQDYNYAFQYVYIDTLHLGRNILHSRTSAPFGTRIRHVTIGDSIPSIKPYTFYQCHYLTSITIPNNITSIEDSAFNDCNGLTSVSVARTTPLYIFPEAFSKCTLSLIRLNVPAGAEETYSKAYVWRNFYIEGFSPLPSGKCGDNLTWTYDFKGTLSIAGTGNMDDLSNYPTIKYWGRFRSEINTVVLPTGMTSIGSHAFYNCRGLTSITIPNSVTSIEYRAFENCYRLKNLILEDGSETLTLSGTTGAFNNTSIDTLHLGRNISHSLTNAPFGTIIRHATIGNSVTSIGSYAFANCYGLTSITIPNKVTSIGSYAFRNCTALCTLTSLRPAPPAVQANTFSGVDYEACCLFVVPEGLVRYQTTNVWKEFWYISTVGNNCDLASLSVWGYPLSPEFNASTTTYSCTVENRDSTLNIIATTADNNAFLTGTGNQNLLVGTNTFYLVVVAQNGTSTKTYTLHITRKAPAPKYTVNITQSANGGVITVATIPAGTNVPNGTILDSATVLLLTATPNTGYEFEKWWDDNTQNPLQFTLTQNVTIAATFEDTTTVIPPPPPPPVTTPKYTVNITQPANGGVITVATIPAGTNVPNRTILDSATVLLLTATPNTGYTLEKWWDNNADNPRQITLTQNVNITATFKSTGSGIADELTPNTGQWIIYPNPVINGQLTIIARHSRLRGNDGLFEIYDMNGKCVYVAKPNSTSSIVNGTFSIDVSHLPTGTYLLRISQQNNEVLVAKVVKV